jgi:hypothetical protein
VRPDIIKRALLDQGSQYESLYYNSEEFHRIIDTMASVIPLLLRTLADQAIRSYRQNPFISSASRAWTVDVPEFFAPPIEPRIIVDDQGEEIGWEW